MAQYLATVALGNIKGIGKIQPIPFSGKLLPYAALLFRVRAAFRLHEGAICQPGIGPAKSVAGKSGKSIIDPAEGIADNGVEVDLGTIRARLGQSLVWWHLQQVHSGHDPSTGEGPNPKFTQVAVLVPGGISEEANKGG